MFPCCHARKLEALVNPLYNWTPSIAAPEVLNGSDIVNAPLLVNFDL